MDGYIIIRNGEYLKHSVYTWHHHDKPEDAYVYSNKFVKYTKKNFNKLENKPTHKIPAKFENGKTIVTGEIETF